MPRNLKMDISITQLYMGFLMQKVCSVAHAIRHCTCEVKHIGMNTIKLCFDKTAQTCVEGKIARLHQRMHFISLLLSLKLSGRFRVGFGFGSMLFSNTIEH